MSYAVRIVDREMEETLTLPMAHHLRSRHRAGNGEPCLNITFNYYQHMMNVWQHGLEGLSG